MPGTEHEVLDHGHEADDHGHDDHDDHDNHGDGEHVDHILPPQHVCPVLNMKYGVFERKEGESGEAAGIVGHRPPGSVLIMVVLCRGDDSYSRW